jgi:hypothetical protein
MKSIDQDMELKLRSMRLLWKLGYFVRKKIDLVKYQGEKKEKFYTDIDVLGVKHDELFERNLIICDCKTGSSSGNSDRIFHLAGMIVYTNANRGFFVRDYITESMYLDLASKGRIQVLSSDQLKIAEKTLGIDPSEFFGSFSGNIEKELRVFITLKQMSKKTYEYLIVKNWFDSPYQRILRLALTCRDINQLRSSFADGSFLFLLGYTLSLLSTAILDFSNRILFVKSEDRAELIKQNIVGGSIEYHEKKEMLSSFHDFMKKEIKNKFGKVYDVPKDGFTDSLTPTYVKYLIDIVTRVCLDTTNARHIPRILDLLIYEGFLHERPINKKQIGNDINIESINLTKDFITFALRSEFIDKASNLRFDAALNDIIWNN